MTTSTDDPSLLTSLPRRKRRVSRRQRKRVNPISYTYDVAGNVLTRTYPDTTQTTYTYDQDSRLATVASGGTTIYGYDAASNLTQTTFPTANGYIETRNYDKAGRLTEVKNARGTSILSDYVSTLDPAGNPTQIQDGASTTMYAYDESDRLSSVCFQAGTCPGAGDPFIRWTYDKVGNRKTEQRANGVNTSYTYNALDQMTQAGAVAYTYDQNGNEKSAGTRTFTYDLANRLKTTTSASTTTTYTYDGDGKRLQASTGTQASKKTNYLWDVNSNLPQLALERDGNNALIRRYVYGSRLIAMRSGASDYYYHYDALGSVRNVTSSTGVTQWTDTYEPFGAIRTEIKNVTSAPDNPMKFTGEYLDPTGLYHLRARQYDPAVGRFLRPDPEPQPLVDAAAAPYGYVEDKPTSMVDPTGNRSLQAQDAAKVAVSPDHVEPRSFTCSQTGTLEQRERCTFDFFINKRLTKAQSAACVGNLWYESGQDLDAAQWELGCSDHSWNNSNCGVGIAQWALATRKQELLRFSAGVKAVALQFEVQLAFVWRELSTGVGPANPNALRDLQGIRGAGLTAVNRATRVFMTEYENPDKARANLPARQREARKVFRRYG